MPRCHGAIRPRPAPSAPRPRRASHTTHHARALPSRRCRTLFEKQLEFAPYSAATWQKFAEFEVGLQEVDRVRALYELAISQPVLDMPELLWKGYIDFEISQVSSAAASGLSLLPRLGR